MQSNLTGIYQQVKFYLQEQRFVLFSGTPCQVEGSKDTYRDPTTTYSQ